MISAETKLRPASTTMASVSKQGGTQTGAVIGGGGAGLAFGLNQGFDFSTTASISRWTKTNLDEMERHGKVVGRCGWTGWRRIRKRSFFFGCISRPALYYHPPETYSANVAASVRREIAFAMNRSATFRFLKEKGIYQNHR